MVNNAAAHNPLLLNNHANETKAPKVEGSSDFHWPWCLSMDFYTSVNKYGFKPDSCIKTELWKAEEHSSPVIWESNNNWLEKKYQPFYCRVRPHHLLFFWKKKLLF